MSELFPFDQNDSILFYRVLYLLTWMVHAFFTSYVLAGSLWLSVRSLVSQRSAENSDGSVDALLRDWMPFTLSAAITAGVAPLLFVQILYPQAFYTANLLLNWRWMVVVPVITVSFYLLYVQKSRPLQRSSIAVRAAVTLATAGSFLFVAFCWTANHHLALDAERWPEVFAGAPVVASRVLVLCRLLMWVAGTIPVMAIFVRWQLQGNTHGADDGEPRLLAVSAVAGAVVSAALALAYYLQLPSATTQFVAGRGGWIWGGAIAGGAVLQLLGWNSLLRGRPDTAGLRWLTTAGCLCSLSGVAVVREMVRSASSGATSATTSVADAAEVGGFGIFLVCTLLNVVLCGFCIRLILPALQSSPAGPTEENAT